MTVAELLNSLDESQRSMFSAWLRLDPSTEIAELENNYWDFANYITKMYLPRLQLHCGSFNTLFDNVADFFDYHRDWMLMNSAIWARYFRTMVVKYNLLHNTDKTQEETTYTTSSDEGTSSGNSSNSSSRSNKHIADNTESDTATTSSSNLHQLSAANQTDFHNKTKDTANGTDTRSGSVKRNETDTGSDTSSGEHKQEYNNERTIEVTHKVRAYGNIGVTTNQQMLAEERQHLAFNVLDKIIEDFKKEFCIMIY